QIGAVIGVAEVLRPIDESRDAAVGRAAARALFDDPNQIAGGIRFALEVSPAEMRAAVAGVDEQPIRQGTRPRGLRDAHRTPEYAHRFGRHTWGIDTGGRRARAGSTERLLIPQEADLVARRHLPGDACARVLE